MAAKRGHKRAVVAMAPKQTRFTRMRWLPTDQTPAREGLKRATALRGLKSWSFHSKAPARHGREPTAKSNPTNHMHPGRRRCFLSRRLLVVCRFHSQPAFHRPNPRSGTPGRDQIAFPLTASHSHGKRALKAVRSIVRLRVTGCVPPFPNRHSIFAGLRRLADRFFVPVPTWCRRHFRRSRALGHNFLKRLAGGLGFEPRLAESESAVLPLDDPPPAGGAAQAWASVAGELTSTPGRDWVGPGSAGGAGGRAKRGYFAARASSVSR